MDDGGSVLEGRDGEGEEDEDEEELGEEADENGGINLETDGKANTEKSGVRERQDYVENEMTLPLSLMLSSLSQQTCVALLYHLEQNGRRITAFSLASHLATRQIYEAVVKHFTVEAPVHRMIEGLGSPHSWNVPIEIGDTVDKEIEVGDDDKDECLTWFNIRRMCETACDKNKDLFEERPLRLSEILVGLTVKEIQQGEDEEDNDPLQICLMMGKLLLIHDVMMQVLPLKDRCHLGPSRIQLWELRSESLQNGLDFYFSCVSKHVSKLSASLAAGRRSTFETAGGSRVLTDLFDGRLFNTILVAVVRYAHENNWKVDNSFFGFSSQTNDRLSFIWNGIAGRETESFLPLDFSALIASDLLDIDNLPLLPPAGMDAMAKPPSVYALNSDFFGVYSPGHRAGCGLPGLHVDKPEFACPELRPCLGFNRDYPSDGWDVAGAITDTQKGEFKKLNEWVRKKLAKLNDVEKKIYLKKREERMRHQIKNAEFKQAQSLAGSSKLFHNAVVDLENHPWAEAQSGKSAKSTKPSKLSGKGEALLKKNEEEQLQKLKDRDAEVYRVLEKKLDVFGAVADAADFNTALLDVTAGFYRITDSFENFAFITSQVKTSEIQLKCLMKLVKTSQKVVGKFRRKDATTRQARKAQLRSICLVFRLIHEVYEAYSEHLTGKNMETLQNVLWSYGFRDSARSLFDKWKQLKIRETEQRAAASLAGAKGADKKGAGGDKKKGKDGSGKKDKAGKEAGADSSGNCAPNELSEKEIEKHRVTDNKDTGYELQVAAGKELSFQLKHMGLDMRRTIGKERDNRVLFVPDPWQKNLLDVVDKQESALVCAPTSSGKTFICYYAMERVLRFDDDSVVVYVAPSKALVHQVRYDIVARFGNKQYKDGKDRLKRIVVRDYSTGGSFMTAQLVVTDPYILETVLLSPDIEYRKWINRIRYVIFDEIHCIGNEEGGALWERILQLIQCPFLALSATIGNPTSFHSWLQRVNADKVKGDVHLVCHHERFSDLSYYVHHNSHLYPLNPVALLRYRQIMDEGLPPDFYLQPSDCVELFNCLSELLGSNLQVIEKLKDLHPDLSFDGTAAVTKDQYRVYQTRLMERLLLLIRDERLISEESFGNIVKFLQRAPAEDADMPTDDSEMLAVHGKGTNPSDSTPAARRHTGGMLPGDMSPTGSVVTGGMKAAVLETSFTGEYLKSGHFICMVRHLEATQRLPALVFNMNVDEIFSIQAMVTKALQDAQWDKYYGTEESAFLTKRLNKQRMDEYHAMKLRREMQEKLKGMNRQQKEEQALEGDEDEEDELLPPPIDVAEEYDQEFSFANRKVMGSHHDVVNEILDGLTRQKLNPLWLEGLRRGIGMHHDVLPVKFKDAVQLLFRLGYLRVVIATQTLALGIHMPCRTTVFAGDSMALTPLLFKQMSGRAGRRGFDLNGHVIFWDIPFAKVRRLIVSPLSVLSGTFPGSPTLALRMLHLHERVDDEERERVEAGLLKVLQEPLFAVSKRDEETSEKEMRKLRAMIGYRFRFAMDLLYREELLNASGHVAGPATVTGYLFETEPANLVLGHLLLSGILLNEMLGPPDASDTMSPLPDALHVWSREDRERLEKRILFILSHFIHTKHFSHCVLAKLKLRDKISPRHLVFSASTQPLLPSLSPKFMYFVNEYNSRVLKASIDGLRVSATVQGKLQESHFDLPASGTSFCPSALNQSLLTEESTIFRTFSKQIIRYCARSPFAALCGRRDCEFTSVEELCDSVREDIPLTVDMIPVVKSETMTLNKLDFPNVEESSRRVNLTNSYIDDFFQHRKLEHLVKENGLQRGEDWYSVRDFIRSVEFLSKSFTQLFRIDRKDLVDRKTLYLSDILSSLLENLREIFEENQA
eukprot:GHVQ01004864.1.p1 GENE.GHVQ01004864.1~~GHVQ01004864.1.p1  ORF type:complete len:2072 (-),score=269.06 GHVQ01004864.1:3927-9524(-)